MTSIGGKHKLVGFVDLGKGHELMTSLSGKTYFRNILMYLYIAYFQYINIPSYILRLKTFILEFATVTKTLKII